jgi:hypothetical protein
MFILDWPEDANDISWNDECRLMVAAGTTELLIVIQLFNVFTLMIKRYCHTYAFFISV